MKYMTDATLLKQYGDAVVALGESLIELSKKLDENPRNLFELDESMTFSELQEDDGLEASEKVPSLEDVRKVLTELSRAGYTDAVRQLIVNRGFSALSEVPKSEYAALLKEAEAITNAT